MDDERLAKVMAAAGIEADKVEPVWREEPAIEPNGKDPHEPGAKLDGGKVRADLLLGFSRALWAVAEVLTYGAAKYTAGGWCSVPDGVARYTAAMFRHVLEEGMGAERDSESGLRHDAHAAWNALARLELRLRGAADA